MTTISFRLPDDLAHRLEQETVLSQQSRQENVGASRLTYPALF
jgi:predicted transcriptional regulator